MEFNQKRIARAKGAEGRKECRPYIGILLLLFLAFTLSACAKNDLLDFLGYGVSPTPSGGVESLTVSVAVNTADGITFLEGQSAEIPFGSDVSFPIELEEGVLIESVKGGAVIENGAVTLKHVCYPTTVEITTRRLSKYHLTLRSSYQKAGEILSDLPNGDYWEGTEVTVTAKLTDTDWGFLGFSLGNSYENEAEIVETASSYTFTLEADTMVYANFLLEWVDPADAIKVPDQKWAILYHTQGGIDTETGTEGIRTTYFSNEFYYMPNTLLNNGQFEREGYVLLGYNTKKDGSGTYYAPGWNIKMPTDKRAISLFCVWAKESDPADFECSDFNDGLMIRRYNGNDTFLVIPETIGGKPVRAIFTAAIRSPQIESIVLSGNLRTVESNAILGCTSLRSVYFSDSITAIKDNSIFNCPNFSTLYMMAVNPPTYTVDRNGCYAVKFELLATTEVPKIIIASGSNGAYGIDTAQLETLLKAGNVTHEIVNYGSNANTAETFYLEVMSHFINEGDYVLCAPEINAYQYGANNHFNPALWQIFEGAYDAFSLCDLRHYDNYFSSFCEFNAARAGRKAATYESFSSRVNRDGDYATGDSMSSGYQKKVDAYLAAGGSGSLKVSDATRFIEQGREKINRVYDMIAARGGTVLFSFAATNRQALTADSQIKNGEVQNAYKNAVDTILHGTRISDPSTYIMEYTDFFDSDYHLTKAGRAKRTVLLASDILAYFRGKAA